MNTYFNNKTIVITGASSGVGAACARRFIQTGANVVLAARTRSTLEALANELGPRALAVPCDVSNRQDCIDLIETAADHFSGIDVLVNNAGYNARGNVEDVQLENMEKVIEVNLKAPMRLSKLALPHLKKSGGAIVNVASLAGRFPLEGEASYSSSKFGLRAFSLALAEELSSTPVTVSLVSPGPIETGFILEDIDEVPDLVFSQPMSSADDVAEKVLQCAEDGKRERAIPAPSGVLATAGYLLPGLRKALKPLLEAQGKRSKARYRNKQGV